MFKDVWRFHFGYFPARILKIVQGKLKVRECKWKAEGFNPYSVFFSTSFTRRWHHSDHINWKRTNSSEDENEGYAKIIILCNPVFFSLWLSWVGFTNNFVAIFQKGAFNRLIKFGKKVWRESYKFGSRKVGEMKREILCCLSSTCSFAH